MNICNNKMISNKGYYYFEHQNPKHNIKLKKLCIDSIVNISHTENKTHQNNLAYKRLGAVVGKSCANRFNENSQVSYRLRYNKKSTGLTFEKLQHILCSNTGRKQSSNKIKTQNNPQNYQQLQQFNRKGAFHTTTNQISKLVEKTSKNKSLRQVIFNSQQKYPRTQSQISQPIWKQSQKINKKQEQIVISSMRGVFVPSVKFKYQKSKSTRRHKTEME